MDMCMLFIRLNAEINHIDDCLRTAEMLQKTPRQNCGRELRMYFNFQDLQKRKLQISARTKCRGTFARHCYFPQSKTYNTQGLTWLQELQRQFEKLFS